MTEGDSDSVDMGLASQSESTTASYIVVFKESVPVEQVRTRAAACVRDARLTIPSLAIGKIKQTRKVAGLRALVEEDLVYERVFRGFVVELEEADVAGLDALRAHPDVANVAEDKEIQALEQSSEPGMERVRVKLNATADIDNKDDVRVDADIAVLDTGIDPDHPDLNVYEAVSFVEDDPTLGDPYGHGTHVAGIAAALDNSIGVYGVAPGARLWSVKVLNATGGSVDSRTIMGLEYVLENAREIDVVNMSMDAQGGVPDDRNCGQTSLDPMHLAICSVVEAGVVVVVAAGNGLDFFNRAGDTSMFYPAKFDEVIAVSAVTERDGLGPGATTDPVPIDENSTWRLSNFGYGVDIAAPGVEVVSTLPGGQYGPMTGTSMAAPHVAGAVALWIATNYKPRGKKEVRHVRNELVRMSFPQNGFDNGFRDTETYAEPFLDVAPIDLRGGDPLEPALFSDRYYYKRGQECPAAIVAYVLDGQGRPVKNLPSNGFIPFLRGGQVEVGFQELGGGYYLLALDVSELSPGLYDFYVIAQNPEGFARTAGVEFVVRSAEPSLVIQSLAPSNPILAPGSSPQIFSTAVTYGDGQPVSLFTGGPFDGNELLDSGYSGGANLNWTGVWLFPWVTYGRYSATASTSNLGPGTYTLVLTAMLDDLSGSAKTSFEVASPAPGLIASLTTNTTRFDFTQTIPPQDLTVDVFVQDEFLLPVEQLTSGPFDPITVFIDGVVLDAVSFEELPVNSGNYRSEGIDLSSVPRGIHGVHTQVDAGGLMATSNAVDIEVIRRKPESPIILTPIQPQPIFTCPGTVQIALGNAPLTRL